MHYREVSEKLAAIAEELSAAGFLAEAGTLHVLASATRLSPAAAKVVFLAAVEAHRPTMDALKIAMSEAGLE